MSSAAEKTTKEVYRDCLRLIKHMAGTTSPKAVMVRNIVKSQFMEHAGETNPALVKALKERAERSLSQYLFYERTRSDPRFKKQFQEQAAKELAGAPEADARSEQMRISRDLASMGGIDRNSIMRFVEEEQAALKHADEAQLQELADAGLDEGKAELDAELDDTELYAGSLSVEEEQSARETAALKAGKQRGQVAHLRASDALGERS